jgi:hypothetical protein
MTRIFAVLAALAVIASSQLAASTVAEAHERRTVGPYQFVVGFLSEPAFAGAINGIDLTVTDTRTTPPKNVEGVEKTLSVEVFAGGLSTSFKPAIATRFGQPGKYAAYFMPTKPGSYRFVFKGKVESQDVTETFESGPGRFNDAEDPAAIQYPVKAPEGAALTDKLDAIDRDLGSIRALAIVAIVLAIVLPIGNMFMARRRT